ncbi:MAG: mechanosensitive ion channel domain-containing protein [Myxococcota bacterium]
MEGSETWILARPILAALGSFVVLFILGWFYVRRRAASELLWVPYLFSSAAFSLWFFFLPEDPTARSYAVSVAIGLLISAVIHLVTTFFLSHFFSRKREIRFPPLLRNVVLGFSYAVILLLCVKMLNRDFSLTPLLVTSGVLSLILGLALQDILGNFLAGVVLTVEKPFKIDDWIEAGEYRGVVVGVTWRTTKILTRDNDYLIIPNRIIADSALVNRAYPTSIHQKRIEIGLPYATLPSQAEQALLEAAGRVRDVLRSPPPQVWMTDFADSSIVYELGFWVDKPDALVAITSQVRREIFYALKRYGISVPFPVREVYNREGVEPSSQWMEDYRFRLSVIDGPLRGLSFPVRGAECFIGRSEDCGVELMDPSISKRHAALRLDGERYAIEDLGSAHGTRVNGRPAAGQTLRSGDEISLGASTLRFEEVVVT